MSLKEIKEMINLMDEHGLAELEMERDGLKIKLRKSGAQVEQVITGAAGPAPVQKEAQIETKGLQEIKSPMVGTFYRAASPESSPFVDIEGEINPGDVICIIEAMKLMNEIKAETRGRIKEILVENGSPVEFNQTLFLVESIS
jgi:acetyl-CoA carboxylase biotin carboxyl carrier protein